MRRHDLQCLYLDRLARLTKLHAHPVVTWSATERRLIDRAPWSTYQDCDAVGLTVVARAVLAEMR